VHFLKNINDKGTGQLLNDILSNCKNNISPKLNYNYLLR